MEEQQYTPPNIPAPSHTPGRFRRWVVIGGVMLIMAVGAWALFGRTADKKSESVNPSAGTAPAAPQPAVLKKNLTVEEEKKYGTNPNEFDTDHDGLSDDDEIHVWHTNPAKFDTDGDKFGDGYEVINGFNPNGTGKLK